MRDFQCQTKWGCEEMWCHLGILGSVSVSRRPALARLFISCCVSLATRTSTQVRGASSPTVGSREQPPTQTSFLDAPMLPTQVTPRQPVGLSSAATAAAARRAMGFARGSMRTSAGSWRWAPPTARTWRRPGLPSATSRAAAPSAPRGSPTSSWRLPRARYGKPALWQWKTSWCTKRTRKWSRPRAGNGSTTGFPWKVQSKCPRVYPDGCLRCPVGCMLLQMKKPIA